MSDDERRRALRRTWPQRLLIATSIFGALLSFVAAAGVWFIQQQLEERNLVVLAEPPDDAGSVSATIGEVGTFAADEIAAEGGGDGESVPVETFPQAEPAARNILITGADNNSCIDPDSRFAPAFGDRSGFGERSDTIMMWRINPATSQVAVLSFPRDLWVTIPGRSSRNRINVAYERDNPQRLVDTIRQNFGIETDHFVQIDFCAFKTLVDAVDGVGVPFDFPVQDAATGLFVPEPGCFTFDGDHALAYVRSRKLEYFDESGRWVADGTADRGRISRQQDFIRRVADELLANRFSPEVVRGLLETSREYVVTDNRLTVDKILEFGGVLRNIDPTEITTYQVQARGENISGNAVLVPTIGGENMQAILRLFRGEATLAGAPEQVFDEVDTSVVATTTPLTAATTTTAPPSTEPSSTEPGDETATGPTTTVAPTTEPAPTTTEAVPFDTIPEVEAEEIVFGIVPDSAISCT